MRRVLISGCGLICAVGDHGGESFASLMRRKSGLGKINILKTIHRDTFPACEIKHHDSALHEIADVPLGQGFTRTSLLAMIAAKEAIRFARLAEEEIKHTGLISATTTGGIREFEDRFQDVQNLESDGAWRSFLDTADPGEHTERLTHALKLNRNFLSTISTACSSSAGAIIFGARLIRHGLLDRVICGGSDTLSKMTLNGFHSLMIISQEPCRPFDENRKGLNPGEGAAYLVLESDQALQRSGRRAIAELRGYASFNDAFHQTASSPDGSGALRTMSEALKRGNLQPEDIDYINAHGTGTENNDLAEGLALQNLFGKKTPPFSSTKPCTGHTMAAAGSMEAAFCLMALEKNVVLPNLNFSQPMKELAIQPEINLRQRPLRHILSNSFGFGGHTASLLFSRPL
ncbi:MAG: beta-ketoacyl-[acyl-carrier-protein] synthase family protein [Syntrophobacterales bacterium]|jgi:3-oxoacyl-[acyl-carrier-protein] synthase-1|nr:beta-ketoacyl-[acyl-carrier-protein] synthase family protein [Syntrophobacterales bacterium]